jgi:hypothetical protein
VEYSTVFIAVIPAGTATITAQDSVSRSGREIEVFNLKLRSVSLDDIIEEYRKTPSEFADGLRRILEQLSRVPGTRQSFERFLANIALEPTAPV